MKTASGPDWFAIIGAAGGAFAVVWTLWRAYRERERLHVAFYAFEEDTPSYKGLVARIDIVNVGTLPTHIVQMERVKKLPYGLRWPLRLMSFRTRDRRLVRWALSGSRALFTAIPKFKSDVLPPRQLTRHRLDQTDGDIERWLRESHWLVVNTALRWYATRISDNRPPERPNFATAP